MSLSGGEWITFLFVYIGKSMFNGFVQYQVDCLCNSDSALGS